MTASQNDRYQRRFGNPATRPSSNERNLDYLDAATRRRVTDLLVTLDGWDLVAEAQQATRADADRRARWETTLEIRRDRRRGDPGE